MKLLMRKAAVIPEPGKEMPSDVLSTHSDATLFSPISFAASAGFDQYTKNPEQPDQAVPLRAGLGPAFSFMLEGSRAACSARISSSIR